MSDLTLTNHSFVIPAYGKPLYLEDCLKSLLNQTVRSNIIIVTSTPSNELFDIAARYNIPCEISDEHIGIASDWNYALHLASSQFVTIAHQDDIYHAEYTSEVLSAASINEDVLIIFTNYHVIDETSIQQQSILLLVKRLILNIFYFFRSSITSHAYRKALLSFGNPICCPTVTYNTSLTKQVNFDSNYHVNLDWKYWIDLLNIEGCFMYIKKPLLKYRSHSGTTTSTAIKSGTRHKEDIRCFNLLWPRALSYILSRFYELSYKVK